MKVIVEVQNASSESKLPAQHIFTDWVNTVLQYLEKEERKQAKGEPHQPDYSPFPSPLLFTYQYIELTIRLVDENEALKLNHKWRQHSYPTNILSFPLECSLDLQIPLLGDLVICAPIVTREAAEQHKSGAAHWAHLVIHGTLHLLGYDHIDETQAQIMESLEIKILQNLGYPNPYE
jgi:probable rRNA maturation factor